MAMDIDDSFIRDYEARVHHNYQRMGGYLKGSVRVKDGIVGESTTFQVIGKGMATTKARHGTVTPMNQTHTPVVCTLADLYAGDYVDKLDEAKTNIDERDAIAKGGAWALGRKVDDQIITVLDTTSESIVSWTVTSEAAIRNALLEMCEAADANDIPNDGMRYGLLTPKAWAFAATVEEFSSSDYVGANGQILTEGAPMAQRWKSWNGVMWKQHSGLPGLGTATAKVFLYHKNAVGYATGAHSGNVAQNQAVSADIWWNGERVAHFINHAMSGGACMIDTTGVIEGNLDDTASLPTS